MALGFSHFVDRTNVRMVQRRRSLSFPFQPRDRMCFLGQLFREQFEGNTSLELEVFSFIDNTHPALAQLL